MKPNKLILFISLFLATFLKGFNQDVELLTSIKIDRITDASADSYGFLYVSNNSGDIFKYNQSGKLLLTYSAESVSPIYSLDVSKQSKIFGFYKSEQSYIILDRFLNQLNKALQINEMIGQASETAFSADNNIWFFDEFDFSLKKLNLQTSVIQNSINLSLIISETEWDLVQIVEYQNKLFLYNRNKNTYILDNIGNLISFLPIKPDSKFSLFNNKLYFAENSSLKYLDIYTFEIGDPGITFENPDFFKLIIQKELLFLVKKNQVEIYAFGKD